MQLGEYEKCWTRLRGLRDYGRELPLKHAKPLKARIWELRVIEGNVHIRFLFAFVGQHVVLLTHGITKEGEVPSEEIERAEQYLKAYEADPETHRA